jgi:regulator of sirC expression with transglutaminase-like and TPR domain
MDKNTVEALIQLLDDSDEKIVEHVSEKLISYGTDIVNLLENAWEEFSLSPIILSKIEKIIHEIQFIEIKNSINLWIHSNDKNLLDAWIIISKWNYPGLKSDVIQEKISIFQKEIWLEINELQTSYEKVKIINKLFYQKFHFQGDNKNYHSPLNSYINTVLETRKGNPLSLSMLYSILAQNLNIPIYGVNLPSHFVLAYMDENNINNLIGNKSNTGVLFYINAFTNGVILYEDDINKFLSQLKIPIEKSYLEPCSNTTIVKRILTNLIASYQQMGKSEKVNELIEIKELFL